MTGDVYQLSSSFELPLADLRDYLDDPELHPEVEDVEVTRRNNKLLVKAVAPDGSVGKYTPTAQLKASVEEKRVYEDEPPGNGGNQWRRRDEEELDSELVEFASFTGDLETVLQNSALRYPMFHLLRDIALLDVSGSLTAITAEDGELSAIKVVDGEERPATVEVVDDVASAEDDGTGGSGVNWRQNQFISKNR